MLGMTIHNALTISKHRLNTTQTIIKDIITKIKHKIKTNPFNQYNKNLQTPFEILYLLIILLGIFEWKF